MPATFINGTLPAVDFEQLTVSTAVGFTASKILVQTASTDTNEGQAFIESKRVDEALVTVETNPIRVRFDGTNPTASVGHLFNAGDSFVVSGQNAVSKLRMIATGSNATVNCTYFRKS